MADITGNAFMKALQSENVHLVVGESQEEITIAKGVLRMKCAYIADLATKCEGKALSTELMTRKQWLTQMCPGILVLPEESITAVKMFVVWCYQVSPFASIPASY